MNSERKKTNNCTKLNFVKSAFSKFHILFSIVQSNPIPKKIQKRTFNYLVQTFTILKGSPISLLPNGPKMHKGATLLLFILDLGFYCLLLIVICIIM